MKTNLYIPIEISKRELDSRILLSLKSIKYNDERLFPSLFTKIKTRLGLEEELTEALIPLVEKTLRGK